MVKMINCMFCIFYKHTDTHSVNKWQLLFIALTLFKYALPLCNIPYVRARWFIILDRLPAYPCIWCMFFIPRFMEKFFSLSPLFQTSSDAIFLARHVGLRAGIPKEVPAVTVNRLCGSGFQSIVNGCQVRTAFSFITWTYFPNRCWMKCLKSL